MFVVLEDKKLVDSFPVSVFILIPTRIFLSITFQLLE